MILCMAAANVSCFLPFCRPCLPCSASMEAVGLRLLEGSDLSPAFAGAGVLPQRVCARISLSKFAKINTVKGKWALLEDLASVPESCGSLPGRPALATAAAAGAAQQLGSAAPAAAPAAAEAAPGLAVEEVQGIVRSIAVEVLGEGELDSSGQFPAGKPNKAAASCIMLPNCHLPFACLAPSNAPRLSCLDGCRTTCPACLLPYDRWDLEAPRVRFCRLPA